MPAFLHIARFTAQDLVRRRIFVVLALFGLMFILLSFPLRQLTIGQWQRLITNVGLGATEFSLTLIAVFVGSTLIAGDLDRRTLYPLLATPISRASFVIGKFFGLTVVLGVLALAMWLGIQLVLLAAQSPSLLGVHAESMLTIFTTAVLIGALSIFFSAFTTSTLAATFTLSLTLVGHFVDQLVYFASKVETAFGTVCATVAKGLPNFELMNLKDFAGHEQLVPVLEVVKRGTYGVLYSTILVCLGSVIFSRRDLK